VRVVIRTAHRDDGIKLRLPFRDGFSNDDRFRTDRDAPDIGFDMDGSENRASGGAEGRANAMPVSSVIGGDNLLGPVDEVAIITGERERFPRCPFRKSCASRMSCPRRRASSPHGARPLDSRFRGNDARPQALAGYL
jgi:hypothetical protein